MKYKKVKSWKKRPKEDFWGYVTLFIFLMISYILILWDYLSNIKPKIEYDAVLITNFLTFLILFNVYQLFKKCPKGRLIYYKKI